MTEIHSWKCQSMSHKEIEPLILHFDQEIPDHTPHTGCDTLSSWQYVFRDEAQRLLAAMYVTLPGGLIDALYVELTRQKASVLHVSLKEPQA